MVCGCLKFSQWQPQPVGVCSLTRSIVLDFVGRTYYVNPTFQPEAPPSGFIAENAAVSNWPTQGTQISDPLEFNAAGVRCLATSLVPFHGSFPMLRNTDILDASLTALIWNSFIEGGDVIIEFTPTGAADWEPLFGLTFGGFGNCTITWHAAGPTVTFNLYDSTATLRASLSQPANGAGVTTRVVCVINPTGAAGVPNPGQIALSVNGQAAITASDPNIACFSSGNPYLYGDMETVGTLPIEMGSVGLIATYQSSETATTTAYAPFNPNFLAAISQLSKVGSMIGPTINWAKALNSQTDTKLC